MQNFGRTNRTNTALPVCSKPLQRKWMEHVQDLHYRRLEEIRERNVCPNANNNNWGTRNYAGISDQKQPKYRHLRDNAKRALKEDERFLQIEWENRVLLNKMTSIMAQAPSPFDRTVEFGPGIRISASQYPSIDSHVSASTIQPGRAAEPRSLNYGLRRNEIARITRENAQIVKRIQGRQPTYSRERMAEERRQTEQYLELMTGFPERSLSGLGSLPSRPHGASRGSLYSAQSSYSNVGQVGRAPSLQSRPTTVPSDMGGGGYWDERAEGGGGAWPARADAPLEVAVYAKAGMATLTLSAGGRPALEVGQLLCVEPSSDAREYVTVTAFSLRAAVSVQVSPPLRYDHPEGTAVRKVAAQVAEQLRQAGQLAYPPAPPRTEHGAQRLREPTGAADDRAHAARAPADARAASGPATEATAEAAAETAAAEAAAAEAAAAEAAAAEAAAAEAAAAEEAAAEPTADAITVPSTEAAAEPATAATPAEAAAELPAEAAAAEPQPAAESSAERAAAEPQPAAESPAEPAAAEPQPAAESPAPSQLPSDSAEALLRPHDESS